MRALAAIAALLTANKVWAGASTFAAVVGATAAGACGSDPLPWCISGAGATIVHLKSAPTTRGVTLANAMISVALGGLGAVPLAEVMAAKVHLGLGSSYLWAFILSAFWPTALRLVKTRAKERRNA